MKKLISLLVIVFIGVIITSCFRERLYVLSWFDYISKDVIKEFQKEYNVKVVIVEAKSNEEMYQFIKTRAGRYDVVVPSDYMVEKLYSEDLLKEIQYDKLSNYAYENFDVELESIIEEMFDEVHEYAIPYFWGSLGIMYNTNKSGLKNMIEANGFKMFFESNLATPYVGRIGMYDSSRDAIATTQIYLGNDVNMDLSLSENTSVYNAVKDTLTRVKYQWGTEDLKMKVAAGNLDYALVYSGDFFDMMYSYLDNKNTINFDMYVPNDNNIWCDFMAIPITSAQDELAHAFINFFLDFDNAVDNALDIGYCPTQILVYEKVVEVGEPKIYNHPSYYPGCVSGKKYIYKHIGKQGTDAFEEIYKVARQS